MALTAKPISTISYNSKEFLQRKLNQLFKAHIIEDYRYICHLGEDGDKNHIHLLIYPNKRLDTVELREEFTEIDPNNEKPLGCQPFRQSKTDHWLMYVLHDELYLRIHESDNDGDGKIPYELDDVITPFEETLRRDYKSACALRKTKNQKVIDAMTQLHMTATEVIYTQDVRPQDVASIMNVMKAEKDELMNKARKEEIKRITAEKGSYRQITELPTTKTECKLHMRRQLVEQYAFDENGELIREPSIELINDLEDEE